MRELSKKSKSFENLHALGQVEGELFGIGAKILEEKMKAEKECLLERIGECKEIQEKQEELRLLLEKELGKEKGAAQDLRAKLAGYSSASKE